MSEAKNAEDESENSSASDSTVKNDPFIGLVIDQKYRVDAFVGRGGMGIVYQGLHLMMERPIAIKFLHSHLVDSSEFLRRFKHEAKVASRLRHQNAIMLYDYGIHEKVPYLVMEYCPGKTLKDLLIESGAMSVKKLNHYVQQICSVLGEAHNLGIVHRDIKPENMIVPTGHETMNNLRVLDFGIAKLLSKGGDVNNTLATQAGMFFGTPGYAAPEQVCNRELDNRSDIYALGVLFYEALCGALPFTAPSLMELLLKHVNAKPPPLKATYPQLAISSAVDEVIMKCLEKDPANRFQTVGDLAKAFEAASSKTEFVAHPGMSFKLPKGTGFVVVIGLLLMLIIWASSDPETKKDNGKGEENSSVSSAASVATATPTSVPTTAPTQIPTQIPTATVTTVVTSLPTTLPTVFPSFTSIPAATATFAWYTPVPTVQPTVKFVGDINKIIMQAEELYAERQYAQAITLFEQVLAINPKLYKVRVDLGTCYQRLGKKAEALNQYQLALAQNSRYAPAHYEMACLKAISGQRVEALGSLSRAIQFDSRFREAAKAEEDLASLKNDPVFRQMISPAKSVRQPTVRDRPVQKRGESATEVVERLGRELWSLTQ